MQSLKFSLPLPGRKLKKNVFNFCTLFHTFSKSMSRMQRMSLVLWIACKKLELQSGLGLQSIAKSMRRQTSSGRCSAVSRSIHKCKTWVVQSRQRSFQWYLGFENRLTNDAAVPLTLAGHSDSHTPYEVLLNKFLWPMCWSFGIWLEWGSGLRTFKFTAPLENLVLSWVRRFGGDDCVEILRVGF